MSRVTSIVAEDESTARTKYGLAADLVLTEDDDVLETWFFRALAFATLGWPEATPELERFTYER